MLRLKAFPSDAIARGFVLGLLIVPLWDAAAVAQSLDPSRPSDRRVAPPVLRPEAPPPRFELPPIPPPDERAPLSRAPIFLLRDVRFQGNTVFSDGQLATVVKPYIGRRVSTEDLQDIRRRLSQYYLDAGYINSGAVIPDQNVDKGVVTMRIVEGVLSDIDVKGNIQIHPDYIRDRVRLGAGPPLNVRDLQERVQFLLQDPLVKRVDVRLSPGAKLGDAKLRVDVEEEKRFSARLSFSNSRPPSVGSFEGRADIEARNLTGWGDAHRLTYARTSGLENVSFRTEIPITARDTKVSVTVSDGNSEVTEQPFNIIDVESRSRDYEVGVTHPVYRTVSSKLTLGLEFAHRESETFLLGDPFSFSAGPVNGLSKVRVVRFVQDWIDRGRDQVVAVRSSFNTGVDIFGATTNPSPIPDGSFFSWLGQAQWVRRVSDKSQFILRADAQFTPDRLMPLEKYSVGGIGSVRGYRENQLVKDQGYTLSLEGRIPVARLAIPWIADTPRDGTVQLAPFVDYARAWDKDVANIGPTRIYSIGVGVLWQISNDINASVYYARALKDVPDADENSLQDDGIHFRFTAEIL